MTGYPSIDETELYLYEAAADPALRLLQPEGTVPHDLDDPRRLAPARAAAHRPGRSADGTRLFFDSADNLVSTDTDNGADVYEWEATGTGGCAKAAGCIGLISGGRIEAPRFLDASYADGTERLLRDHRLAAPRPTPAHATSMTPAPAPASPNHPPRSPASAMPLPGPPPAPEDPAPATEVFVEGGNPAPPRHRKHQHKRHRRHRHHRAGGGGRR